MENAVNTVVHQISTTATKKEIRKAAYNVGFGLTAGYISAKAVLTAVSTVLNMMSEKLKEKTNKEEKSEE